MESSMIKTTWVALMVFSSPYECADFIEKYEANLYGPVQCVIQREKSNTVRPKRKPTQENNNG
jgi:hypothetical protein